MPRACTPDLLHPDTERVSLHADNASTDDLAMSCPAACALTNVTQSFRRYALPANPRAWLRLEYPHTQSGITLSSRTDYRLTPRTEAAHAAAPACKAAPALRLHGWAVIQERASPRPRLRHRAQCSAAAALGYSPSWPSNPGHHMLHELGVCAATTQTSPACVAPARCTAITLTLNLAHMQPPCPHHQLAKPRAAPRRPQRAA